MIWYQERIFYCISTKKPKELGPLYTRSQDQETQKLNNPIGGELKIGPKGFTLGVETKLCQNDLVPMWYHFDAKFSWS
jgi:hypothetical protein